jgi:hypothetical protein
LRFDGGTGDDDGDDGDALPTVGLESQTGGASQIAAYETNGLFKLSDAALPLHGPGLSNNGNTCYAAAVVQLLRASTTFVALIGNANNTMPVSVALRETFKTMEVQPEAVPCAQNVIGTLLQTVRSLGGKFNYGSQCDAAELLRFLLSTMDNEASFRNTLHPNHVQVSFAHLCSVRNVYSCQHESRKTMLSNIVLVEFVAGEPVSELLRKTLHNSRNEEARCTTLVSGGGECGVLGQDSESEMTAIGPNLIVHLQRTNPISCEKLAGGVVLEPFIPSYHLHHTDQSLLELCAIVHHLGSTHHSGHYIAHVKHANGWWEYDDARVQPKSENDIFMSASAAESAYLLLFRRVAIEMPDTQVLMESMTEKELVETILWRLGACGEETMVKTIKHGLIRCNIGRISIIPRKPGREKPDFRVLEPLYLCLVSRACETRANASNARLIVTTINPRFETKLLDEMVVLEEMENGASSRSVVHDPEPPPIASEQSSLLSPTLRVAATSATATRTSFSTPTPSTRSSRISASTTPMPPLSSSSFTTPTGTTVRVNYRTLGDDHLTVDGNRYRGLGKTAEKNFKKHADAQLSSFTEALVEKTRSRMPRKEVLRHIGRTPIFKEIQNACSDGVGTSDPAANARITQRVLDFAGNTNGNNATVMEILGKGGGVDVFGVAILRGAGMKEADIRQALGKGAVTHHTFVKGGKLKATLSDDNSLATAVCVAEHHSSGRTLFGRSKYGLAPEVNPLRAGRLVGVLRCVLPFANYGWNHHTVDLLKKNPICQLVRAATNLSEIPRLVLYHSKEELWHHYKTNPPADGKSVERSTFFALLASGGLFSYPKTKSGVCNIHSQCECDLRDLLSHLQSRVPGDVYKLCVQLLEAVRCHVNSELAHIGASNPPSNTSTHNCAHVLGECGDNCGHVDDCATCKALPACLVMANSYWVSVEERDHATRLAARIAFCMAHSVVAGYINQYIMGVLQDWMKAGPRKRAVFHFDYKMKLRYAMLRPYVSKEAFFGNEGSMFATAVAFIHEREPMVVHVTNNEINKENWLSSVACVSAIVGRVKEMHNELEEIAFVFDQGSHLYNNAVVQLLPLVCQGIGICAREVVFGEAGECKGICDLQMGVIQNSFSKLTASGLSLVTTDNMIDAYRDRPSTMPNNTCVCKIDYDSNVRKPELGNINKFKQACSFKFQYSDNGVWGGKIVCGRTPQSGERWVWKQTLEVGTLPDLGAFLVDGVGIGWDNSSNVTHRRTRSLAPAPLNEGESNVLRYRASLDTFAETILCSKGCPLCTDQFESFTEFVAHLVVHFASRPAQSQWFCEGKGHHGSQCLAPFASAKSMAKHVFRMHVGIVYRCVTCGTRYDRCDRANECCKFERLQAQMTTGSGPVYCPVCTKAYSVNGKPFQKHLAKCEKRLSDAQTASSGDGELVRRLLFEVGGACSVPGLCEVGGPTVASIIASALAHVDASMLASKRATIFALGYGSHAKRLELWPTYYKNGMEVVSLVLGFVLGGDKSFHQFPYKNKNVMRALMKVGF